MILNEKAHYLQVVGNKRVTKQAFFADLAGFLYYSKMNKFLFPYNDSINAIQSQKISSLPLCGQKYTDLMQKHKKLNLQ